MGMDLSPGINECEICAHQICQDCTTHYDEVFPHHQRYGDDSPMGSSESSVEIIVNGFGGVTDDGDGMDEDGDGDGYPS